MGIQELPFHDRKTCGSRLEGLRRRVGLVMHFRLTNAVQTRQRPLFRGSKIVRKNGSILRYRRKQNNQPLRGPTSC